VEKLGDGKFTCTGPMFKGFRMTLGNMALLRSKSAPGVRVVIASRKVQAADQEMFRHVGIEPRKERILALKSSVHFRADFEPIAKEVLVVKAPGPALADPTEFKWTKLRKGVRLRCRTDMKSRRSVRNTDTARCTRSWCSASAPRQSRLSSARACTT
jgi:microcystin degradation protein MlrC